MGKVIVKWPWVFACVMAAIWLLFQVPSPGKFIADADWGHQLTGANQILFGEHPDIDWRSTYGPFTFYSSAVFQVLFHGAPLAEVVLMLLGYFTAYIVLFKLLSSASGRSWIAVALLAFALVLMPRTYKHYILLWPVVSLAAMWFYMKEPSAKRLWILALIIAVTGLYRPDYGAYTTATAFAAVALCENGLAARFKRIAMLFGAIIACASPWLIFAISRHALGDYLRDNFLVSIMHAEGSALPFPKPNIALGLASNDNVRFFGLVTFLMIPLFGAITVWSLRQSLAKQERDRMIVAIVLAQLCLIQGLHKIDPGHFFQAIPMTLVPMAWMFGKLASNWQSQRVKLLTVAVALVGAFPFLATLKMAWAPNRRLETYSLGTIFDNLSAFSSKQSTMDAIPPTAPQYWIVQTLRYVQANTKPGEKITILPAFPNLIYFSDRPFSGGQMVIVPGYFTEPYDQERFLARLKQDNVNLVVEEIDYPMDGIEARRMSKFATPIRTYLDTEYKKVAHFGPVDIKRK